MARKGNRQKNDSDHNTSNHRQTGAESMATSLSDKKETKKGHDRKPVDGDLSTGDPQCRSTSPHGEKVNNNKNMVNKGRHTQKGNAPCGKKSEDKTSNISNSVDISSQVRDTANELLSDNSEPRTDGVPIEDVMDNHGPSDAVEGRNFRSLSLHMLEVAKGWIEQLPQLKAFTDVMTNAHNYVRVKVEQAYPVILTWVLQFGNLMFFLAMVWLDCGVRGLDSLLRLGTTSFLTVLWCSTLSVTVMIGVTKMIMIMVIVGLFVVFTGFVVGCVILALCAAVILWLYGSFWTTGLVTFLGGAALALRHDRVALFITTLYSMYCARSYVGWLGLLLGLNLSFISSDILVYIVKNKINDHESSGHSEQTRQSQGRSGHFSGEPFHSSPLENDRSSGVPSTSGAETELTSEEEVVRLLNCNDHYSALGLNRFDNIDVSYLKKEYRKKAMLVHPDKNMGNEKAVEAFKKLQNAYEVLLDSLKRKTYDDELRSEELFNFIQRFQSPPQKNGRRGGVHRSGFSQSEAEDEGSHAESRRIACKKCGDFHIWIRTERSKSRARWCQDCKDFHQAKDGDGWLEQSFQPLLFGLLQKRDPPCVYVCAESRIYDATEWFICQGMRCSPNSHKPSFQVNTSVASKHSSGSKGAGPSNRGGSGGNGAPAADMSDAMTEEELFEWLQNAVQSGMFEASSPAGESPAFRTGSSSRSGSKKKKGKKQW